MKKLILLISLLVSCKSSPVTTHDYAASVLSTPPNAENVYNVPVEVVPENKLPELAPVENHSESTFVTVPASSAPTVLEIIPQKKKLFRKKSDPVAPVVVVSSVPEVKAQTSKQTPGWYYWAAIIGIIMVILLIIKKYASPIISAIKAAIDLITRYFHA